MKIQEDMPRIIIMGFKSEINNVKSTLNQVNSILKDSSDCTIQLLNAKAVAGKEHILHATIHAILSFKRKNNIANDLGMEICVRTSAQRQISRAIKILGLKEGSMDICAVFVGCSNDMVSEVNSIFKRDDSILDADESILKEIYNIKNEEIGLMGNVNYILMEKSTTLILDT
ncbi:KEOPS complex subunit Cgi121 [Methanobacterium alcaliphilum]|uniref:KEOPS complex subunit Cgi121 n=1 Tax=Methanobacterium alcaliphilum TaxID=392018 RepID=UPI00200AF5FD|nr:KEOPS complex subunit Cgi121 [Methanobacterium alcaliphilum]MCK9152112.1 KEOPS complex subunit Cgi121 [Methanobacterium alcaliphilum]